MINLLRRIEIFISLASQGFWDWHLSGLIVEAQDEEAAR